MASCIMMGVDLFIVIRVADTLDRPSNRCDDAEDAGCDGVAIKHADGLNESGGPSTTEGQNQPGPIV
jgi:hypothetical protein